MLLVQSKCISDQLGTISNEHLDELRSSQVEEAGLSLSCAGPGNQGGPYIRVQDTFGGLNTKVNNLKALLKKH